MIRNTQWNLLDGNDAAQRESKLFAPDGFLLACQRLREQEELFCRC